ncbi:MAG: putative DNA-binding domain-containing protein [Betaproteobacteria bacterium]|nr:putative DNA-binding domain-containing protein [Betaproteobacteria bacterium]
MSPDAMAFTAYQSAFAARIRAPRGAPLPLGAPARRMRVYEELLFNNLEGFLLACYPITREILGVQAWRRTVRRFFIECRCPSPWFRDLPKTFLDWIEPEAAGLFPSRPWLAEFMHYEWLELDVFIAPDEVERARIDPQGDLLTGRPALAPGARLACYRYPVHRIGPARPPEAAAATPYCYLLFRDDADAVRFILLNPLAAHLIALLRTHSCSGREALARLAGETRPENFFTYLTAGEGLLREMRAQGAVLGTWSET